MSLSFQVHKHISLTRAVGLGHSFCPTGSPSSPCLPRLSDASTGVWWAVTCQKCILTLLLSHFTMCFHQRWHSLTSSHPATDRQGAAPTESYSRSASVGKKGFSLGDLKILISFLLSLTLPVSFLWDLLYAQLVNKSRGGEEGGSQSSLTACYTQVGWWHFPGL